MARLRSNVELCLTIEGVGLLIGGWVFQDDPGRIMATLHVETGAPMDIASAWVRLPRPDVVDAFRSGASVDACEANGECGFLALACGTDLKAGARAARLELSLAFDRRGALTHQLNPEPIGEPLDPKALSFLRHNVTAFLGLVRRHQVYGNPSIRRLVEALGSAALELAGSGDSAPRLGIDLCVFGADEGLVMAGRLMAAADSVTAVQLSTGRGDVVDVLPFMHFLPVHDGAAQIGRRRFVVAIPSSVLPALSGRVGMQLTLGDGHCVAVEAQVSAGAEALTRFGVALDSEAWFALSEAVAEHWVRAAVRGEVDSLSHRVRLLAREGRDATQHVIQASAERIAAAIDRAFIVPGLGVLTIGWLVDPDQQVRSLHAHIGEGPAADVLPEVTRLVRPDIRREYERWLENASSDCFGFVFLANAPNVRPETLESSLHYTIRTRSGTRRRLRTPVLRRCDGNPLPMIREILGHVPPDDVVGLSRHVAPIIERLWKNRPEMTRSEPVHDVGEPVRDPAVSIIVPIYGRYDYIEYQLALFADDPDLREAEIVYVIDDPRISDEVVRFCRQIQPLFRLPVRILACRHNRGFAGANNVGVAAARGPLLLLLNSDVMPKRPGWLSELRRLYASMQSPGALGAKLLYPDGSLQHAGMCFEQVLHLPGIWLNSHPGKGLPAAPSAKGTILSVQAVTAACLMVSRELYLQVGGLDESYILGDFEDSDFCMKVREAGRQICCATGVELYHLERQSQRLVGDHDWRLGITMYNAWVHAKRWDGPIRRLAQESA